jgi:hypothetical protein
MKAINVFKNGVWLTLPPLAFSLLLMNVLPTALTPAQFNRDIPSTLLNLENTARVIVFALPAFFSISLSTKTQRCGLIIYLAGLALYLTSHGAQNFFPESSWSTSMIGFTASAYSNVFWMVGLGLMGEKFYFLRGVRYRPIFYIAPAVIFVVLHATHAAWYFSHRIDQAIHRRGEVCCLAWRSSMSDSPCCVNSATGLI